MASARPAIGCRSVALVCFALAYAAVTGCGGPANEPLSPQNALRQKLRQPVSVEASREKLRDVLAKLSREQGIDLVIDGPALETESLSVDDRVTLHVRDIPLASALRLLLRDAGLTFDIDGGSLRVTTPSARANLAVPRTHPIGDLTRAVSFGEEDVARLVRYLFSTHPQPTKEPADGDGVIVFPGMLMVNRSELVHDEISAFLDDLRRVAATGAAAERAPGPPEAAVRRALETPLRVQYQKQPLAEIADDLGRRLGINIVPDAGTLDEANLKTAAVTYNAPDECPLGALLWRILRPLDRRYEIVDDCVLVSASTSERRRQARVYPLGGLLDETRGIGARAIVDALCAHKVPTPFSPDGRLVLCPVPGGLLAYATAEEHEQFRDILAQAALALDPWVVSYAPAFSGRLSQANRARMERLAQRLDEPAEFYVEGIPLAAAAWQLSRLLDLPLLIDERELAFYDIRADAAVTVSTGKHLSLRSSLRLLVAPLGADFFLDERRQAIVITSRPEATSESSVRVHRFACDTPGRKALEADMRKLFVPTSFGKAGGSRSLSFIGDALVLGTLAEGHREIGPLRAAVSGAAGANSSPCVALFGSLDATLWAALDRPVTVDWRDKSLSDALADLRRSRPEVSVTIRQDGAFRQREIDELHVTMVHESISPRAVLSAICDAHGLEWLIQDGVILLAHPVHADHPAVTTVFGRPRGLAASGVSPEELANVLTEQLQLGPSVLGGQLVVTTSQPNARKVWRLFDQLCRPPGESSDLPAASRRPPQRVALEERLLKAVRLTIRDETLSSVLARLEKEHSLEIFVKKPPKAKTAAKPAARPAIQNARVTAELADMPLAEALDRLLAPHGLGWTIGFDRLVVGSPDELEAAARDIEVYDARAFHAAMRRFCGQGNPLPTCGEFLASAVAQAIGRREYHVSHIHDRCVLTLHNRGHAAVRQMLAGADDLVSWAQTGPPADARDREKIAFLALGAKHPTELVRAFSAFALGEFASGRFGRDGDEAVRAWIDASADPRVSVRRCALEAMARFNGHTSLSDFLAAAFAARLAEPYVDLRLAALGGLHRLGKSAAPHVTNVAKLLRSSDENFREAAALVLIAAGRPGLDELVAALGDPHVAVCRSALVALGEAGQQAEFAIPAIVEFIRAGDGLLFTDCCDALAGIGISAVPVLKRLALGEGLKQRPSYHLRRQALRCLIQAAQDEPTLKTLKELAIDPVPEIRAAAREALRAAEE